MPSLATVLAQLKKVSPLSVRPASEMPNVARIPTGLFPLDFALGGGIPKGRITTIFGPEDTLKSSVALKIMASYQEERRFKNLPNDKFCIYIDTEGNYDYAWSQKIGIDVTKLLILSPDNAEQTVDMVEGCLSAPETGLVVLDSLGMMITEKEVQSFGDKQIVGGSSQVVARLLRKAVHCLAEANKEPDPPTLLLVNQIRHQIGLMYGNPEYQPGGNLVRFAPTLIMRFSGKKQINKDIHPSILSEYAMKIIIKKQKFAHIQATTEFEIRIIPDNKGNVLYSNDAEFILSRIKEYELLTKNGVNWELAGENFPSQKEIKHCLTSNNDFCNRVKNLLIETAYNTLYGTSQVEDFTEENPSALDSVFNNE